MEDKSTFIETNELLETNDLHKERWKESSDREDIMKNKLRLLLVVFSFLVLLSLVAVVTILAWAYVDQRQDTGDGAKLHEPTRLYSSTALMRTPPIMNSTQPLVFDAPTGEEQEQRSAIPGNNNGQMHLIRVYEGISSGAVCLDGTPPAYYLRPGKDLGTNRWLLHFNGGAWCFDEAACLERSRGSLGSTKHLPPSPPVIQGINSANEQINPDFYDWNLVWIVYCDGASFTGDREDPVVVRGENIFFRGKRVLDAVIDDLMKRGFQNAEGVILTGSSAGSMTAMFAVDRLAERLPNVPMHVLSDAGYFIETQQLGGRSVGGLFKKIYEMHNSSFGLNQACIQAFGIQNGWRCFLPQHTFKFIKHPVFVLNAAYDVWALLYFVGVDCKFPTVTTQSMTKKSEVDGETGNTDMSYVTNHRNARDISGFEISPYFRISKEIINDKPSADVSSQNSEFAKNTNARKDGIPSKVTNPEKRNFDPHGGDSDLVDSLNTFSINDYADNYYNERVMHPRIENEAEQGAKLHLNIDQENPASVGRNEGFVANENEPEIPSVPNMQEMGNILANDKQEALTLNPLANSVSTLNTLSENVHKDGMDTETIGLLNEVFRKLKKLMPKNGTNATGARKLNETNKSGEKNSLMAELKKFGGENEKGELLKEPNDNISSLQGEIETNKTDELQSKEEELKKEKLKSKEITKKINEMLKVKQAEMIKAKQFKNQMNAKQQNKETHSTSSEIIANMFKKAGKLPNRLNGNVNKPALAGPLSTKILPGLHRNSIMQNKNKRSANIIKEYINILRSDPPECTENQMINVMKYRNAMLRATAIVKASPDAAIFLVSCIEHSMSLFDETWTGVIVQKRSIQQAFGDWYFGRSTNHYIIDGVYPTNLSCP